MTVSPPTLYWYQLEFGTLAPAYWGQLDTCVRSLCTENSITLPTAPWYSTISGTLTSAWILQIDTAVRALSTALSVTPPTGSPVNLTPGTETANYFSSLDACVRALCVASGAYHADAVHFDGTAGLTSVGALSGVVDSPKLMFSVWSANFSSANTAVIRMRPEGDFDVRLVNGPSSNYYATIDAYPLVGDGLGANTTDTVDFKSATWQQFLLSIDTTNDDPNKRVQLYVTGLDVTDYTPGSVPGFSIYLRDTSVQVMWNNLGTSFNTADIAQMYLAVGTSLDLSNPANLAKFISGGKPVDLLTSGAPAPVILFDGDASTFGTNQGTGGAFTLTGSLTNASTSPSD